MKRINIVNEGEKFNKKKYEGALGDYDKDGLANIDDANPYTSEKNPQKVEQIELAKTFEKLLTLKNQLDDTMDITIGELDTIAPKGSLIYARTKTPYSILKKLVEKRLTDKQRGLTDLVGTTIVVDDLKDLRKVDKAIKKGEIGKVVEREDMYKNPKGGYRAIHYLVEVDGYIVEVQLKTKRQKAINEQSHEAYKKGTLNSEYLLYVTDLANKADKGNRQAYIEFDKIIDNPTQLAKDIDTSFEFGGEIARSYDVNINSGVGTYAKGGEVKVGKKYGDWSITQYEPITYDDFGSKNGGLLKLVNQETFDEITILNDNALRGSKWFTESVKGLGISDKNLNVVIDKSVNAFKLSFAKGGKLSKKVKSIKKEFVGVNNKLRGVKSDLEKASYKDDKAYNLSRRASDTAYIGTQYQDKLNKLEDDIIDEGYAKGGKISQDDKDRVLDNIDKEGINYGIREYDEYTDIKDNEFQKLRKDYIVRAKQLERQAKKDEYYKNLVDNEGLDYAFTEYIDFEEVKDQELKSKIRAYDKAKDRLLDYLGTRSKVEQIEYLKNDEILTPLMTGIGMYAKGGDVEEEYEDIRVRRLWNERGYNENHLGSLSEKELQRLYDTEFYFEDNEFEYAKGGRVKDVDRFAITIVQDITYETQYGYDETYENTTYETRFKTEKEANDRANEIEKDDEKKVQDIYKYTIPSKVVEAWNKLRLEDEDFSETLDDFFEENYDDYAKGGRTFKDSKSIKFKVGSVKEIALSTKILDEFDIPYEVGVDEIRVEKDDYLVAVDYLKGDNNKNIDLSNVITSVGSAYAKGGFVLAQPADKKRDGLNAEQKRKASRIRARNGRFIGNDFIAKNPSDEDILKMMELYNKRTDLLIDMNDLRKKYGLGMMAKGGELMDADTQVDYANGGSVSFADFNPSYPFAKGGWIQDATAEMEKKGTIGAFTAKAKRYGMTPQEFAKKVLADDGKTNYTLKTKRQAQFMKNSNPEMFSDGGEINRSYDVNINSGVGTYATGGVTEAGDVDFPSQMLNYAKGGVTKKEAVMELHKSVIKLEKLRKKLAPIQNTDYILEVKKAIDNLSSAYSDFYQFKIRFAKGGAVSKIDTIYVEGKYRDDGSDFSEDQETNDVGYVVEDFRNDDRGLSVYRIFIRFNDGTEREITKDDFAKGGMTDVDQNLPKEINRPILGYVKVRKDIKSSAYKDVAKKGDILPYTEVITDSNDYDDYYEQTGVIAWYKGSGNEYSFDEVEYLDSYAKGGEINSKKLKQILKDGNVVNYADSDGNYVANVGYRRFQSGAYEFYIFFNATFIHISKTFSSLERKLNEIIDKYDLKYEGIEDDFAKGGKTQGYNSRLDESLAERDGAERGFEQKKKDRRDESKAMEKSSGKRAYSSVKSMDKPSMSFSFTDDFFKDMSSAPKPMKRKKRKK